MVLSFKKLLSKQSSVDPALNQTASQKQTTVQFTVNIPGEKLLFIPVREVQFFGCLLSRQKMNSRVSLLERSQIAINFGVAF